ncbi:MAG: efflux RND transporter periplasmic adaptor subunit [Chloroflexus sp.]
MSTISRLRPRLSFPRLSWPVLIAAGLVIAVLTTVIVRFTSTAATDPLLNASLAPVTRGNLRLTVNATGSVEPNQIAALNMTIPGRVQEILVTVGQQVAAGDPLLRLDDRQLQADVAAAQAAVALAQADLQALRERSTPEQRAEAAALVAAAQAGLAQTQSNVTAVDIAAAQAAVNEARARLQRLLDGPTTEQRVRAEAALTQAKAELERQRELLAAAKLEAQARVEVQANALRNAQSAYSDAYWNWEHVKAKGTDPRTGRALNETEQRDFERAFERATRTLADAETALAQAQVAYQTAVQNELSGLAAAEARVASAQAELDALLAGPTADAIAAARAQLARAEAELARLTGSARQNAIAVQQAQLEAAQARLAQLTADPRASDLARAEARLAQAQAQLDAARIRLEEATLRAPFAGVIAAINVAPGEAVGNQAPIVLIDLSRYLVQATVDEVDVSRVTIGQPVEVTVDALNAPPFSGQVINIEPLPAGNSGVTAYRVTIAFDPAGQPVRPGMTTSTAIIVATRSDVLQVPAAALRTVGTKTLVDVVTVDSNGQRTISERAVQTGLRANGMVEIQSGLAEGEQVVVR